MADAGEGVGPVPVGNEVGVISGVGVIATLAGWDCDAVEVAVGPMLAGEGLPGEEQPAMNDARRKKGIPNNLRVWGTLSKALERSPLAAAENGLPTWVPSAHVHPADGTPALRGRQSRLPPIN